MKVEMQIIKLLAKVRRVAITSKWERIEREREPRESNERKMEGGGRRDNVETGPYPDFELGGFFLWSR